jgi:hypothetical protein
MVDTTTMWSHPSFDPYEKPAENAVLEAVTNVVVAHLRRSVSESAPGGADPVLIQVDGPGRTMFLEKLEKKLDPLAGRSQGADATTAATVLEDPAGTDEQPWTAIWFDAWQYQRVAPPWWWLMSALDKQLRERYRQRGWRPWVLHRARDLRERLLYLVQDLLWVVPGALVFFAGWQLSATTMWPFVKWLVTAAGGVAAVFALYTSVSNALRRYLLAESPRGTTALLRSTDPMEDLLRRYAFLVRSAGGPIVVLIDNLDRCHAEYVVEMLEGIQTLLRNPKEPKRWSLRRRPSPSRCPLIAFVIAADGGWLCDSYLHVYKEFEASVHEPGRPFGLIFVDKIFDVALRIPTVPAAAAQAAAGTGEGTPVPNPFGDCRTEHDVRVALRKAERAHPPHEEPRPGVPLPVAEPRQQAVMALARIELEGDSRVRRQCLDTARDLDELLAVLDPGPTAQRRLDTAYCVARTTQLLAGHEVDDDADAISRLGLWTILEVSWPLLAEHLAGEPAHVEHLADEGVPAGMDPKLAVVFMNPVARRLADGVRGVYLTAADIEKFTTPLRAPRNVRRIDDRRAVAGRPPHPYAAAAVASPPPPPAPADTPHTAAASGRARPGG